MRVRIEGDRRDSAPVICAVGPQAFAQAMMARADFIIEVAALLPPRLIREERGPDRQMVRVDPPREAEHECVVTARRIKETYAPLAGIARQAAVQPAAVNAAARAVAGILRAPAAQAREHADMDI